MELSIRESGRGYTEMRLSGDCDLYCAPQFKKSIQDKLEGGIQRILIDLSEVRYLDSTGVGAIIYALQASKRMGAEIRFRGVTGNPRRVLERTNIFPLMRVIPISPLPAS